MPIVQIIFKEDGLITSNLHFGALPPAESEALLNGLNAKLKQIQERQ